ncbi:MAG: hypothetical protein LBV09_07225 [Deferribacteraceae bacterium]|jgi:hypothetical protein|nr:hypothetical protein [Deferribacteraceae bacterium]
MREVKLAISGSFNSDDYVSSRVVSPIIPMPLPVFADNDDEFQYEPLSIPEFEPTYSTYAK